MAKRTLILNLAEEIKEYVGDIPEETWGYDSETSEYGSPIELATAVACNYFGYLATDPAINSEDDDLDHPEEGRCQLEPGDQFYVDVQHTLNQFTERLLDRGLVHLTACSFSNPYLICEVSTEMDMAKYANQLQPPRS
jgi:hypothetical protein